MICQNCNKYFKEGTGVVGLSSTTKKIEELYCSKECNNNVIKMNQRSCFIVVIMLFVIFIFMFHSCIIDSGSSATPHKSKYNSTTSEVYRKKKFLNTTEAEIESRGTGLSLEEVKWLYEDAKEKGYCD